MYGALGMRTLPQVAIRTLFAARTVFWVADELQKSILAIVAAVSILGTSTQRYFSLELGSCDVLVATDVLIGRWLPRSISFGSKSLCIIAHGRW